MLMCSCLACQKATGTGHATVALVRAEDVAVTGALSSFTRPADSGASMTRSFCPRCGTPIHAQSSRAQTLLLLPVGLFGPHSDWYRPGQLIFAATWHEWDSMPADLPRHAAYREPGPKAR